MDRVSHEILNTVAHDAGGSGNKDETRNSNRNKMIMTCHPVGGEKRASSNQQNTWKIMKI